MKSENFVPNLDCMSLEELKEHQAVFILLADYCLHKETAQGFRENGEINQAMRHESCCASLYRKIPENFRW